MVSRVSSSPRRPARRVALATLALVAVLGVFTAACSSSKSSDAAAPSGPTKAAWIYVGPINDGGWTQTHNAGREARYAKGSDS